MLRLFSACVFLIASAIFIYFSSQESTPIQLNQVREIPEVSVIKISSNSYDATVKGYGEAKPRYTLVLSSEVEGSLSSITPQLESGVRVSRGEILAQIDPVHISMSSAGLSKSWPMRNSICYSRKGKKRLPIKVEAPWNIKIRHLRH